MVKGIFKKMKAEELYELFKKENPRIVTCGLSHRQLCIEFGNYLIQKIKEVSS